MFVLLLLAPAGAAGSEAINLSQSRLFSTPELKAFRALGGSDSDLWVSSQHHATLARISTLETNAQLTSVASLGVDGLIDEIAPVDGSGQLLLLTTNTTTGHRSILSCLPSDLASCTSVANVDADARSIAHDGDGNVFWVDGVGDVRRNGVVYWAAVGVPAFHIVVQDGYVWASRGTSAHDGVLEQKHLSSGAVNSIFSSAQVMSALPGVFAIHGDSVFFLNRLQHMGNQAGGIHGWAMGSLNSYMNVSPNTGGTTRLTLAAGSLVFDGPSGLTSNPALVWGVLGSSYNVVLVPAETENEVLEDFSRRVVWDAASETVLWSVGTRVMRAGLDGVGSIFAELGTRVLDIDLDPEEGRLYILRKHTGSGSILSSGLLESGATGQEWQSTIGYHGIAFHPGSSSLVVQSASFMTKLAVPGWDAQLLETESLYMPRTSVNVDPRSMDVFWWSSTGELWGGSLEQPDAEPVQFLDAASAAATLAPESWVPSVEQSLAVGLTRSAGRLWLGRNAVDEEAEHWEVPLEHAGGLSGAVGLGHAGVFLGLVDGSLAYVPMDGVVGSESDSSNCGEDGCGSHGSCELLEQDGSEYGCVCEDGYSGEQCEDSKGGSFDVTSPAGASVLLLVGILAAAVVGANKASQPANPSPDSSSSSSSSSSPASRGGLQVVARPLPVPRPPGPKVVPQPMVVHRPAAEGWKGPGMAGGLAGSIGGGSSMSHDVSSDDDDTSLGSSFTLRTDTSHSTNGRPTEELLKILAAASLTHLLAKLVAAHIDDTALGYLTESTLHAAGIQPGDAARIMGHMAKRGSGRGAGSGRSRPGRGGRPRSRRSRSSQRSQRSRRDSVERVEGSQAPVQQTYTTVPISRFRSKVPLGNTYTLTSVQSPVFDR